MQTSGLTRGRGVRPVAVAGRFYPGDPDQLREFVDTALKQAPARTGQGVPKALIAPHAGYPYSGPIAASAYSQLSPGRETITRVVLVGPSHFVHFRGLAVSSAAAFETPLGVVPVDTRARDNVRQLPQVQVLDDAHAQEHALEVQLPFLQMVLDQFSIVPLTVGEASYREVSEVLEAVWGGPETVIVVSSDLSHYYESQTARRLDQATAEAIHDLDPDGVVEERACGRIPICGLLLSARKHRLGVRVLDLRNSGDTAGPRHQVVGYGAFAFEAEEPGAR